MFASLTLSRYLAMQFLLRIGVVFLVCLLLVFVVDLLEILRRSSRAADMSFPLALEMAMLHAPSIAQTALPFAVLFGAMWAFLTLSRTNELVIARASGMSAWQFLRPAVALGVAIGLFSMMAYNPLAATMVGRFTTLEARHIKGETDLLDVKSNGLWLRQAGRNGPAVIHAARARFGGRQLDEVMILEYRGQDAFARRYDAERAVLQAGYWHLEDVWSSAPAEAPQFYGRLTFPTKLTVAKIQDSFAPPETLSFWDLPDFIALLDESGFSSAKHVLHWHTLLAQPVLLFAMVLIAAAFSLRVVRFGGLGRMIGGCVVAGFVLYFLSDVALALALSGALPPLLAAWTPATIAALLGLGALFQIEDG